MIRPYCTPLADKLTAAIFDGQQEEVHRIALMTGDYPLDEKSIGGLCRRAFQERMEDALVETLTPEFVVTLLKSYLEQL
jgi:hypothetical protein